MGTERSLPVIETEWGIGRTKPGTIEGLKPHRVGFRNNKPRAVIYAREQRSKYPDLNIVLLSRRVIDGSTTSWQIEHIAKPGEGIPA